MLNQKKWVFGVTVAVLATAVTVLLWVLPLGPSYEGKSIQAWFYQAGDPDSPLDPDKDQEAFRAMGPQAVPFLVNRLEAAPSARVKGWLTAVSHTAGEVYRQRKEMWQIRAAYLLGEMGPAAKPAVSNLVRAAASGNWALRGQATVALMKIRGQPPDALIEKLKDTSDWKAWYEDAMMVGSFGSRAEPAVPLLVNALGSTNNIIQAHALIALGMIGREPNRCIPAIVPFLNSPSISDRQKAMGALLDFGTNALPAKPAIQAALSDSDLWVRHEAEIAMKMLQGADDRARSTKSSVAPNAASPPQ
jgi:HEAT repeat protein